MLIEKAAMKREELWNIRSIKFVYVDCGARYVCGGLQRCAVN